VVVLDLVVVNVALRAEHTALAKEPTPELALRAA
jgi:hypothetical protein